MFVVEQNKIIIVHPPTRVTSHVNGILLGVLVTRSLVSPCKQEVKSSLVLMNLTQQFNL